MAFRNETNSQDNVTPRFTENQLSEIIEWFDKNSISVLNIDDGTPFNVITIEKLKEFLNLKIYHRRNFHYPSYAEIMNEIEKSKAGITKMITKAQFIEMLEKWVLVANIKHELKLAFKVFDTEKRNYLEIDDIKVIVTAYADVFNEEETRELLRDANVRGDGNVFYEDFIDSLFSIAPELYQLKAEYLYENPDEDPSVLPELIVEEEETPPPPSSNPLQPEVTMKKEKKK